MDKTVISLIICNSFFILSAFVAFIVMGEKNIKYFSLGPNENLTLVNLKINNWKAYTFTIIGFTLFRFTYLLIERIGKSYINNTIFNFYKKNLDKTSKWVIILISTLVNYLSELSFLLIIITFVTQIDYALISIVFGEILFFPFCYYFANTKHFENISKKPIKVNINPMFTPKLSFNNVYEDNE